MGKNTYFLTREGELFIEALFRQKPEVGQLIRHPASSGASFVEKFNVGIGSSVGCSTSPGGYTPRKSKGGNDADSRRLTDWVANVQAGDEIEFNVSKERRKSLHDLAGNLSDELQSKGLQLLHESKGVGRNRVLSIRAIRMGVLSTSLLPQLQTPTKRPPVTLFDTTPDLSDDNIASPSRSSFAGVAGRTLEGDGFGTPPKRPRTIPPAAAAGHAAMLRQALFESKRESTNKLGSAQAPLLAVDDEQALFESKREPAKLGSAQQPLALLDDDETEEDGKPAAKTDLKPAPKAFQETKMPPKVSSSAPLKQNVASVKDRKLQEMLVLLDSDDDEELLKPVFEKPDSSNRVEIVDLVTPRSQQLSEPTKLQIFIDDRERSRNHQPRFLRMQLNQFLASQIFSAAQPESLLETVVIERSLQVGDFAFRINGGNNEGSKSLPVCLERKRIGDLVQRSASKDHWRQLLRGQESSLANILLLEGDFRTADTFVAFGADMDAWSPRRHVIDDETSLLRGLARLILSIHNVRLIQTRDEQESLRSVAAYGLVAAFSSMATHSGEIPVFGSINTEQVRLSDRLVEGGIPSDLAKIVGEEIGSIQALERLYAEGETECNDELLVPLIAGHCGRNAEKASGWSAAIHSVFSTSVDVSETKRTFAEFKHFVTDEARLLILLHQGIAVEEAVDKILSSNTGDVSTPSQRRVRIEISTELKDCFPDGNIDGAFYRVKEGPKSSLKLPRARLWTEDGFKSRSEYIDLVLIDGLPFVDIVVDAIQNHRSNSLAAARDAASRVLAKLPDRRHAKNILMVRGLRPALDRVAKGSGYKPETRFVVDMVFAELSLSHGIVVFQAIRKTGDMEAFVQNFALACFHFQLLTRKRTRLE